MSRPLRRPPGRALAVAAVLLAPLLAGTALRAHPGHGTLALVGTILGVTRDTLTLEVRDAASGGLVARRLVLTRDTRLRVGKEAVPSLAPWIGARAVATVDYEEGPDGQTRYTATKVQVTPPKPSKPPR